MAAVTQLELELEDWEALPLWRVEHAVSHACGNFFGRDAQHVIARLVEFGWTREEVERVELIRGAKDGAQEGP